MTKSIYMDDLEELEQQLRAVALDLVRDLANLDEVIEHFHEARILMEGERDG